MSDREFSRDIPGALAWFQHQLETTPFGEITLTAKVHEGRPVHIERTIIQKDKLSGDTAGASYDHRRR